MSLPHRRRRSRRRPCRCAVAVREATRMLRARVASVVLCDLDALRLFQTLACSSAAALTSRGVELTFRCAPAGIWSELPCGFRRVAFDNGMLVRVLVPGAFNRRPTPIDLIGVVADQGCPSCL